jgi:hypothetical protein
MDCNDVDKGSTDNIDGGDLFEARVINLAGTDQFHLSVVGVYHDGVEVTYYWVARESVIRSQGEVSTASLPTKILHIFDHNLLHSTCIFTFH